jgi:pimeloyl-ACP methyl ester carboxylesterase
MVRRKALSWVALLMLLGSAAAAQDITGDWQGTLKVGRQDLRLIVQIAKGDVGWKATLCSIDQTTSPIPATSVALEGSNLKLTVEAVRGTYEGRISPDGASITGTWTQGAPLPLVLRRATKETAWPIDPAYHSVQFITVDKNVKLEVLDWGGTGRALVLLTGLGDNAHVYDKFASKLASAYHVYGITRRGFGASSHPDSGYTADRLGDDVLEVIESLKIDRPVLVGHSIAGEELSSVGSRHPEKVAGLIYLDAAYAYAYYDRSRGDLQIDLAELEGKLEQLHPGKEPKDPKQLIVELRSILPQFERDLEERQKSLEATPVALLSAQARAPAPPPAAQAIMAGVQKYEDIRVPILAIYALPHDLPPVPGIDPAARAAMEARDEATTGAQMKAFEAGIPSAHAVRLPHANHYVFRSNESDVLREMNAFLSNLN